MSPSLHCVTRNEPPNLLQPPFPEMYIGGQASSVSLAETKADRRCEGLSTWHTARDTTRGGLGSTLTSGLHYPCRSVFLAWAVGRRAPETRSWVGSLAALHASVNSQTAAQSPFRLATGSNGRTATPSHPPASLVSQDSLLAAGE